jgi:hypothetical protein
VGVLCYSHQTRIANPTSKRVSARPFFSHGAAVLGGWGRGKAVTKVSETRTPRMQINAGRFYVPRSFLETVVAYTGSPCFKTKGRQS